MTAPRLSDRDIANIRRRFWAEKARQEREDMLRETVDTLFGPGSRPVSLVETTPGKNGGVWL